VLQYGHGVTFHERIRGGLEVRLRSYHNRTASPFLLLSDPWTYGPLPKETVWL
jgi:hypothetical protein